MSNYKKKAKLDYFIISDKYRKVDMEVENFQMESLINLFYCEEYSYAKH